MIQQVWLKLPWEKRAFPVRLKAVRAQNTFHICIEGEGRTPLELGGDARALVPIYEALKTIIHEEIDYREGPVAASPPDMFEKNGPEPELTAQIPDIVMDDLGGDPRSNWALIAARFPWLADTVPEQYLRKRPISKEDETARAVAKLLPYRAELLDENGQPKHGAKTQVASIMQFKQTGGGFARKIDAYLAALAEAA